MDDCIINPLTHKQVRLISLSKLHSLAWLPLPHANRFNKAEIKKEETSLYIMENLKIFLPKLSQMQRRVLLKRVDSIEEFVASFANIMGERVANMVFIWSMRFYLQWLNAHNKIRN